jgi:hypothetical protein
MCPSPPMPETTTQLPGRASVTFRPLYTVTPAHRTGASGTKSTVAGREPTWLASARTYSAKAPSTEYPVTRLGTSPG